MKFHKTPHQIPLNWLVPGPSSAWFQAHAVAFEKAKGKAAEMALNTAQGVPLGGSGFSFFSQGFILFW